MLDRDLYRNQLHGKPIADVDVPADGALTNTQLGDILAPHWPGTPPGTLVYAVRNQLPLVQVPPRGVWGRSGPIAHTSAEAWLGDAPAPAVDSARIIRRYLAAFGPASIRDMQTWSGLTKLREVVDPLRPELEAFRDEQGVELFDLTDAPRPDEASPTSPRFLYDFDNALLSFADRSRIVTDAHTRGFQQRGVIPQAVLIDGFTAGAWAVSRGDDGTATLTIRALDDSAAECDEAALREEGSGLLRLLAPDAATHDVRHRLSQRSARAKSPIPTRGHGGHREGATSTRRTQSASSGLFGMTHRPSEGRASSEMSRHSPDRGSNHRAVYRVFRMLANIPVAVSLA